MKKTLSIRRQDDNWTYVDEISYIEFVLLTAKVRNKGTLLAVQAIVDWINFFPNNESRSRGKSKGVAVEFSFRPSWQHLLSFGVFSQTSCFFSSFLKLYYKVCTTIQIESSATF